MLVLTYLLSINWFQLLLGSWNVLMKSKCLGTIISTNPKQNCVNLRFAGVQASVRYPIFLAIVDIKKNNRLRENLVGSCAKIFFLCNTINHWYIDFSSYDGCYHCKLLSGYRNRKAVQNSASSFSKPLDFTLYINDKCWLHDAMHNAKRHERNHSEQFSDYYEPLDRLTKVSRYHLTMAETSACPSLTPSDDHLLWSDMIYFSSPCKYMPMLLTVSVITKTWRQSKMHSKLYINNSWLHDEMHNAKPLPLLFASIQCLGHTSQFYSPHLFGLGCGL